VYVSGQIPLDPATGELVGCEIEMQIQRVFANLQGIIEAAGASFANVVKLNVYLTDLKHFALVNQAMAQYFREPYPARAAVGVASLPRGAQVEMECVLYLG
jgi:reactive intermediate/imine deaminase